MNLLAYFRDKDSALNVHFSLFQYPKIKIHKPLLSQINRWTYAEEAYKALAAIDDRYNQVTPQFRDDVVKKALCAEFSVANLNNKTKGQLFYPNYLDILRGINYFSLTLKIQPSNAFEHSIMQEIKFYKEQYTKDVQAAELTDADYQILNELKKIKVS